MDLTDSPGQVCTHDHLLCFQADTLVSLRLSPEEAMFLAHATDNVRFYHETVGLSSLKVKLIQPSALVA